MAPVQDGLSNPLQLSVSMKFSKEWTDFIALCSRLGSRSRYTRREACQVKIKFQISTYSKRYIVVTIFTNLNFFLDICNGLLYINRIRQRRKVWFKSMQNV